ncbi:MAG: amino acid permease [Oscillospiraceae bacterium]|nr:amino acid permease [Oscillospiraceae bacterium]
MANNESQGTLGFMDLMSIAVGQIIGAGVMVMSISALGMTGRSVNIAFMVAAVFTVFGAFPTIFVSSVAKFHGGLYSQHAVFISPIFAGFMQYVGLLSAVSLGMFAIGLTSYCGMLIPAIKANEKIWSVIFLTAFFILNYFGTQWMAKVQSFMFYFLVAALVMFTVFGLPKVHWAGYFGNELFGQPLFANGMSGLIEAASYLTFATGGATVIMAFSGDAKNPTQDIPRVVIIATLMVAFLYGLLATVIGGVLPPEEVFAAGNLAPIAAVILPKPLYYFFVIAGAGFALGTTLNSSIASTMPPFKRAAADGWFPGIFAKTNKYGVPVTYMFLRYLINAIVLMAGLNVDVLGKWTLIIGNVTNFVVALSVIRIPKLFPEAWAKSPFHVSDTMLKLMLGGTAFVLAIQARMNLKGLSMLIIGFNVTSFVVFWGIASALYKAGKITMKPSYELV